ncbi:MAG: YebC/PmpR family DNA-binding transcriptional regulator, partial [Candidatus Liptonbacteria bacterium]|nr:YebC/PmpR family DNA-binding transcriptional regulator [Candidatus Liptonbacteria bacterium]
MSGHSHWSGIKHQKEITDKKRARVFSKLLVAVSAAARKEPDPNFNPRLRSTIEKARGANVPAENIERAIKRALVPGKEMEELLFEAYGSDGAALLISAVSDNSNRTVAEVKNILSENGGKWAEPGSVKWAFDSPTGESNEWRAKFPASLDAQKKELLAGLVEALLEHGDVQEIFTNAG